MRKGENFIKILRSLDPVLCDSALFRKTFVVLLLFSGLCIIDHWCFMLLIPLLVWAFFIFVRNYLYKGCLFRLRYRKVLYLFFGTALIGILLHCTTNFAENIYTLYTNAILMFLFYGLHAVTSNSQVRKEMKTLLPLMGYLTTLFMLVSYGVLFFDKNGFTLWDYYFGIKENRFVGIFTNANILAFYAVMAIVFLHIDIRLKGQKGKCPKKYLILNGVCMAVNLLSLFLSDSNASLLFLMVYWCFILMFRFFGSLKHIHIGKFILRFGVWFLASAVLILGLFSLRSVSQSTMSYILSIGTGQESPPITAEIPNNPLPLEQLSVYTVSATTENQEITFNHENTNIDSGRFKLWKQAVALFTRFPLFGIGHENIVEYGKIYLGGLKFSDFHNGYLTILVSTGLIGLAIFVVFAVALAKGMMKVIFLTDDDKKDNGILSALVSFLAAYCVYSFFEITIFGTISYFMVILWLLLGYAVSYLFKYEKNMLKLCPKEKNKYKG